MTVKIDSAEAVALLDRFEASQRAERQREKDIVEAAFLHGSIPVPEPVVVRLKSMFITDAMAILKKHPGYALESAAESLRETLRLFNRARDDLFGVLDRFSDYAASDRAFKKKSQAELEDIETSVRKELFAFSALAHSLIDHARGLNKKWQPAQYAEKLAQSFSVPGQHTFLLELRRILHHIEAIDAAWQLRRTAAGATSHFVLQTAKLLEFDDWKPDARTLIRDAGAEVDVRPLIADYARRANEFYAWLFDALEKDVPTALADYRRCRLAKLRADSLQSWKMLLSMAKQNKFDPTEFLRGTLSAEDFASAMAFPERTKARVDRFISLMDEYGACDDEARAMAYDTFGV